MIMIRNLIFFSFQFTNFELYKIRFCFLIEDYTNVKARQNKNWKGNEIKAL